VFIDWLNYYIKTLCAFLFSYLRDTCPADLILRDYSVLITNVECDYTLWILSLENFPSSCCFPSDLSPHVPLSTLFLNTRSVFCLSFCYNVSHPYKTNAKLWFNILMSWRVWRSHRRLRSVLTRVVTRRFGFSATTWTLVGSKDVSLQYDVGHPVSW
jgi:hypothetical protein